MTQIPQLFVGGLSRRVFLATRWHTEGDAMVADDKTDVTDQFDAVARERQGADLVPLLDAALTAITLAETLDQARGLAHAALNREQYRGHEDG